MAKKQTQQGTNAAGQLLNDVRGIMPGIISGFQGNREGQQFLQGGAAEGLIGGLQEQYTTGGYDPTMLPTLRSNVAGLAATGGYDPAQLAALQAQMGRTTASGGFDPRLFGSLVSGMTNINYDPSSLATIRGGYGDFATTGGYSPEQKEAFIRQATSGVKGTYDTLSQQLAQSKAKTGGLGTGGEVSQMARQLAQQQAGATLGAKTSLDQMIASNKLAGLGGLGTTESNLAGLRLGGLQSAGGLATAQAGNRFAGLGQQAGLMGNVAGARAGGIGQQIGLESGVAAGRQGATAGFGNLYGMSSQNVNTLGNQILQGLGLNFGTQAQVAQILAALSKNPGLLQTGIGDIIGLGGAAGGILKGING